MDISPPWKADKNFFLCRWGIKVGKIIPSKQMHPMYPDVKIEDVQNCRSQMKWPILFFWPFVFLWVCPLVVPPQERRCHTAAKSRPRRQGNLDSELPLPAGSVSLPGLLASHADVLFLGKVPVVFPQTVCPHYGVLRTGVRG